MGPSKRTPERRPRRASGGCRLGLSVAFLAVLFAGCAGSSQRHASTPPTVFVTTATHWQSAQPSVPVYITVSALAPDTGKPRWQHREEYSPYHQPTHVVVSNGVVYFVADTDTTSTDPKHPVSGDVIALRASDGSQLWRTEVGLLASEPLLDGDTLYLTTESPGGNVLAKMAYALNAADGSIRWKTQLPATLTPEDSTALGAGALVITANTLCFDSCGNVEAYGVELGDGHLAWHHTLEGSLTALPPILDGDRVYVRLRGFFGEDSQTNGCPLITYSVADGHELWRTAPTPCSTYLFGSGVVYTTKGSGVDPSHPFTGSQALVALDGATGVQRYSVPIDLAPQPLAVSNGRIYLENETQDLATGTAVYGERLSARDAATGALLWQKPIGGTDVNCVVTTSAIYIGTPPSAQAQASLAALDPASGAQLWRTPLGSAGQSGETPGIIAPGGDLLFSSDGINAALDALRASDGATRWSFTPPSGYTFQGLTVAG
jgi:outer membrane protein assembly factor BamB